MAKKNSFKVPANERNEFDMLVQRANRRVKSSLKYIQREEIKSDVAQRALVSDYIDRGSWASEKTVFSRSKQFESEKAYKDFKRHIAQWGDVDFPRSVEKVKEGYYRNIIQALTTTAIDNGNGVLTATGRLPGNLAKQIKELSLEQMTNFFNHSDPTEAIEYQGWGSDQYIGVDRGEFVDITRAHLNNLQQLFPSSTPKEVKTKGRKGK